MVYTIKEMAEKTGISQYTLRYYDKIGLLPELRRNKNGARQYTEEDFQTLELIRCLKVGNMPLKEMRAFLELYNQGDKTVEERLTLLRAHREALQKQIAEMQCAMEVIGCKIACLECKIK